MFAFQPALINFIRGKYFVEKFLLQKALISFFLELRSSIEFPPVLKNFTKIFTSRISSDKNMPKIKVKPNISAFLDRYIATEWEIHSVSWLRLISLDMSYSGLYRFAHCGAFLALFRPGFFLSFSLGSRVSIPSFF